MRAVLLTTFLIAAAAPVSAEPLSGSWQLTAAVPPLPEVSGTSAGVRFDAAPGGRSYKVMLGGACNSTGAALDLRGGVTFESLGPSTQQHCADARGAFDRAYFSAFFAAREITRQGDVLSVRGDGALLTFSLRD